MDGRPTLTGCDEAGDYVVPNVLSPRDLVFRPDNMDKTVPHELSSNTHLISSAVTVFQFVMGPQFKVSLKDGRSPESNPQPLAYKVNSFTTTPWRLLTCFVCIQSAEEIRCIFDDI